MAIQAVLSALEMEKTILVYQSCAVGFCGVRLSNRTSNMGLLVYQERSRKSEGAMAQGECLMTDLKRLRELAEAAKDHKFWCNQIQSFHDSANPATILELLDRVKALEKAMADYERLRQAVAS